MSLMEFAVVNNYMGPVATKVMKGYSDEDVRTDGDPTKVTAFLSGKLILEMEICVLL